MQAVAILSVLLLLLFGAWLAAILDRAGNALVAGDRVRTAAVRPLHDLAAHLSRQTTTTEAPDRLNWRLAPVAYLALAALGLSVVPLAPGVVAADFDAGIVLWGACEALTVVVVFLHGWSANSEFPLIGGYRYVAIGLPVMLISMFVLIAAALPAESLSVAAIVESQREIWNVVRQPIGLPLFLLLGLSLTLRGPFDYADSDDLIGGTRAEASGAQLAAWQFARLAMLASVSVMASAVFLGGYLGPVLPGALWLILKSGVVLAVLIAAGHLLARMPPSRMMTFIWTVLLPLSFLDLVLVGAELLIWG
ncbi:complex I subunit 1 family protein [Amorphus sp. 3PC139-8]|uniref:complex I subunit 1 family protein n=1 Tax=Amorphus sp. 3PC139-8 TaxID=2735676 RepID=UPI00345CF5D3